MRLRQDRAHFGWRGCLGEQPKLRACLLHDSLGLETLSLSVLQRVCQGGGGRQGPVQEHVWDTAPGWVDHKHVRLVPEEPSQHQRVRMEQPAICNLGGMLSTRHAPFCMMDELPLRTRQSYPRHLSTKHQTLPTKNCIVETGKVCRWTTVFLIMISYESAEVFVDLLQCGPTLAVHVV